MASIFYNNIFLHSYYDYHLKEPIWNAVVNGLLSIEAAPSKHLIRPQLVLLGASASGALGKSKRMDRGINRFGAGTELLHIHLLCHDDIREHATIRRGVPTLPMILAKHGIENHETRTHLSTIVGEVLHIKAYEYLLKGVLTIAEEVRQM